MLWRISRRWTSWKLVLYPLPTAVSCGSARVWTATGDKKALRGSLSPAGPGDGFRFVILGSRPQIRRLLPIRCIQGNKKKIALRTSTDVRGGFPVCYMMGNITAPVLLRTELPVIPGRNSDSFPGRQIGSRRISQITSNRTRRSVHTSGYDGAWSDPVIW